MWCMCVKYQQYGSSTIMAADESMSLFYAKEIRSDAGFGGFSGNLFKSI